MDDDDMGPVWLAGLALIRQVSVVGWEVVSFLWGR